ncbi:hypothetical protein FQN57_006801 [Myotisia sp. PD_48]|nr:hypothetical protein FQN57_006801 [Myotisia sp. PD_48]
MGTKRPAEDASIEHADEAKRQKILPADEKRERLEKKRERLDKRLQQLGNKPNVVGSSNTSQPQSQFIQLQQIVGDLVQNADTLDKVVSSSDGDPGIIPLLKALNKAFNEPGDRMRLPPPPPPIPAASSITDTRITADPSLPPLPPIKDKALETSVFTHASMALNVRNTSSTVVETSYDRLELLGDAYLQLIATRLIWERFPSFPAGKLAQQREILVKNETLAEYTTAYGLDKHLKVAKTIRNVPKTWLKIKGDLFEAYIAAVILSDLYNGLSIVERWLTQLWQPKLASREEGVLAPSGTIPPKDQLAQKLGGKGIKLRYIDEKPSVRNGGLLTFYIGVYITGWGYTNTHLGSGTGRNKAEAGNHAAKEALQRNPIIEEIRAIKLAFDAKNSAENQAKEN